ncbi:MAG: serine/threonine protein kinase [Chitinispirillaceae bacterium]|nr:serine/threonine protein kinase [Chitinispirillaceae bacterium]
MEKIDPSKPELTIKRLHNTVVLPDGTANEPMGSGYITGILGVGGMANVYEIWNPQLEINRAVKLLHPNYTQEAKQRFETEIKITARLQHPNIVEIHNVGEWNGLPYIEMERINGTTLDILVQERGAFPVEVCTSIGITVCRALRFAHNQEYVIYGKPYTGVIHRDLKPSNIMISFKGILKLMDFGIARPTDASLLTTDGAILGTIQYLSPEQLEGKDADVRSDIYSIGTVLYELILGQKAFPEQNVSKLMMSKVKNEYVSLESFDLRIPVRIKKLIHRCMMQNPEKRFLNTTELLSELTKIHKSVSSKTPEQVLRNFINEVSSERIVLTMKKRFPYHIVAVAAILVVIVTLLFRLKVPSENVSITPVVKTIEIEPKSDVDTGKAVPLAELPVTKSNKKKNEIVVPVASNRKRAGFSVPGTEPMTSAPPEVDAPLEPYFFKHLKAVSIIDSLRIKYGTDDLGVIIERESESRNYRRVLQLYDTIVSRGAVDTRSVMCKIRALRHLNDRNGLRKMLSDQNIDDGEFLLEQARITYFDDNIASCMKLLGECIRTPARFIDGKTFRLEYLYLTAKCKSKRFDLVGDVDTKNDALGSWFDLKVELQTAQDHTYFKEAEAEMQRITSKIAVSQR